MSTLGQKPATQHVSLQKQTITGNGGTSYTLQQSVGSALDIAVFVNNTRQEPAIAYSASGTTLTMTGAVNASDSFYVIFLGKGIATTGLPVDAVGTANINASAVTDAKIAGMTATKLTGTIAGARLPSGSILQAVSNKVTESSASGDTRPSGNGAYTDTGLSQSITPSSTSSKILIITCGLFYMRRIEEVRFRFMRDSTAIMTMPGYSETSDGFFTMPAPSGHLDSPNTTSAVTYKLQFYAQSNYTSLRFNYGGSAGLGEASMTLLEVAG